MSGRNTHGDGDREKNKKRLQPWMSHDRISTKLFQLFSAQNIRRLFLFGGLKIFFWHRRPTISQKVFQMRSAVITAHLLGCSGPAHPLAALDGLPGAQEGLSKTPSPPSSGLQLLVLLAVLLPLVPQQPYFCRVHSSAACTHTSLRLPQEVTCCVCLRTLDIRV